MTYNHTQQLECLKDIHIILEKCNFLSKMHISCGTLLGAIRQGKLNTVLNDWDDLDFSVNAEHYKDFTSLIVPKLIENGFSIQYVWMTQPGEIGQITLSRDSDRLDVSQVFPHTKLSNGKRYYIQYLWHGYTELTKGLAAEYYEDLKEIKLEGLSFYGPRNSDKYLEDMYGPTWNIPHTSEDEYKYWEDSPGLPWWNREQHLNMLKELS